MAYLNAARWQARCTRELEVNGVVVMHGRYDEQTHAEVENDAVQASITFDLPDRPERVTVYLLKP